MTHILQYHYGRVLDHRILEGDIRDLPKEVFENLADEQTANFGLLQEGGEAAKLALLSIQSIAEQTQLTIGALVKGSIAVRNKFDTESSAKMVSDVLCATAVSNYLTRNPDAVRVLRDEAMEQARTKPPTSVPDMADEELQAKLEKIKKRAESILRKDAQGARKRGHDLMDKAAVFRLLQNELRSEGIPDELTKKLLTQETE